MSQHLGHVLAKVERNSKENDDHTQRFQYEQQHRCGLIDMIVYHMITHF